MQFTAIVLAAGTGSRTNLKENKVFLSLGERAMILHSLRPFLSNRQIGQIVIATAERDFERMQTLVAPYANCKLCIGGASRAESVYKALKYIESNAPTEFVLIHDAARPFLSDALLERILAGAIAEQTAVPILAMTDSVLSIKGNSYQAAIRREELASIQTPQAFPFDKLLYAYEQFYLQNTHDSSTFTDDSSIYAKFVAPPHLVQGDIHNKKITYLQDIQQLPQRVMTGIGQDVHRFAEKDESIEHGSMQSGNDIEHIVLGGVEIAAKAKLIAHSDGDVLVHAIMDALLSAAGMLDIGHYFPDTDMRYKGCSSLQLLEQVFGMLTEKEYFVVNLSASILAEEPKLAPYIENMKQNIANVVQIERERVGITVTTTEKLGAIGRSEGIFVTAIATVATLL